MDIAYSFEQMAGIAAVLGGLAFTAAAALLGIGAARGDVRGLKRSTSLTVGSAVVSTLFLVFAALCWSMLSAIVAGSDFGEGAGALPNEFITNSRLAFGSLAIGIAALFFSVGASGWIASRPMGIFTTGVSLSVAFAAFLILDWAAAF